LSTSTRKSDVMCSRVKCGVCGKVTWAGCGEHVQEALRGVPEEQLCAGHDDQFMAVRTGEAMEVAR